MPDSQPTSLEDRIAQLQVQLQALEAEVAATRSTATVPVSPAVAVPLTPTSPAPTSPEPDHVRALPATSRRSLLRTAAVGAAAAGAGALVTTRPAAAATATTWADPAVVTEVTYTGPDLTTRSAVSVGEVVTPPPLPIFPAAVGGYGAGTRIPNGLHGSTTAAAGFGVVAANAAPPAASATVPAAAAIASLGAHARLIGPQATAAAAGVTNAPAVVGPTTGTYLGGELYMDDAFNLWFFVKNGTEVVPVHLAGPSTAGSFHSISPRPQRVLDTRIGSNPARVGTGANPTVPLSAALTGLAASARAVVVNLTVTDTVGSGFHTAYAAGLDLASIRNSDGTVAFSNVNWDGPGQNRANLAIVPVGRSEGQPAISLIAGGPGSTHLVIDLVGYYL